MTNLKKLRLERNLSQQKLAEKFGITQQAIFNYENSITEPDIYMLKQLADFFHTSIDYIIGYSDTPLPSHEPNMLDETPISPKDLYHLSLYHALEPNMQNHIDAILESLSDKK